MNIVLENEDAQLFVVYGLNKSFPGYTSYTNLFNPSYDSAVSIIPSKRTRFKSSKIGVSLPPRKIILFPQINQRRAK